MQTTNMKKRDDNITSRLNKLENDFKLLLEKLKYDDQTVDIRFQLLQKTLADLQNDAKQETKTDNSAFGEINAVKQSVNEKYREFKLLLERFARNIKTNEQQIKTVTDELKEVKQLVQQQKGDEYLIKQVRANDQLVKSMREEINALRVAEKINIGLTREGDDFTPDTASEEEMIEKFHDDDITDDDPVPFYSEEDMEHHFLPQDTYSYLAVARYFNGWYPAPAFTLSIFALCVQLSTLSIFVMDVFEIRNKGNKLNIPPGVGVQVRASQIIALLISCWNQDEVRASFNVLQLGYRPEKVFAISSYANPQKWFLSIFVRILLGCYSLTVTFILIVKSETVRDVMLDFAAVTFVSELDNGIFLLSLLGYMGKTAQLLTLRIKKLPVYERDASRKVLKIPRLAWLFIIIGIMVTFWAWITLKQEKGSYMDQIIFVQFGDDFAPALAAFSGLYGIKLDKSMDGMRVNYVDLETDKATFSYCSFDRQWTFQYDAELPHDTFAKCSYDARSAETGELDILKTGILPWYVLDEDLGLDMPLQHFSVASRENFYGQKCKDNSDCGERMYCADKVCLCSQDRFGLNCEFPRPCEVLDIDPRNTNGFFGTRSWSRIYSSLQKDGSERPIQVYGKPIFIGDESVGDVFDVMIFTGRRWILTDSSTFEDYRPSFHPSARNITEYLAENFHAYWSNYSFYFASEPVDVGTPIDSATPVGLRWFRLETSNTRGVSLSAGEKIWQGKMDIEADLFCAVCNNETNPCFHGSLCRPDGTCDCTTGASGRLCQIPPDGNGLCDVYFNTPEFSFDGGDCCQETCTSTEQYTCGNGMIENDAGVFAYGFIGYPNCQDPRFSSKLSGSTTLYDIVERGTVRCGEGQYIGFLEISDDGVISGFEADLCRAIAAAALGDPEAIEIVETTSSTRFSDLADGKFDVLIRRTTHTAERDIYQGGAQVGFSFAHIPAFYDGLKYGGIPPYSECADKLDFESTECLGLKICVNRQTSWMLVTQKLFPDSMIVAVENNQAEVDGLEVGLCNVIAGEISLVAEIFVRERGFTGAVYELGDNVYSKEPLSAVTRQDDRVWSKFVSWVFEGLIQAEESGITKSTADNLAPTELFGEKFRHMFQHAVAANGNYGEIYEKNLEALIPRKGLNIINRGDSGLVYSFPFGSIETQGPPPIVGGTIELIRQRGILNCGISKTTGFGAFDAESGTWTGFEVDICRGIAAALFSGSPNVNFIPLKTPERFILLAEGSIDVMAGTTTHTLTREVQEISTGEGFDFTPTIYYDGMGFGGRPPYVLCAEILSFDALALSPECPNTIICVPQGSTWLDAVLGPLNVPERNVYITATHEETLERFISGDCNVMAGESARLAEFTLRENGYDADEEYIVGTRKYTKEPLAVVSRSNDAQFSDFLRWVIFAFFYAAEQGITRDDYFDMPATNFLFGDALSGMWQDAIEAVGNYDEIFERNFAGLWERGGPNNLNNKSGPQYFAKPGVAIN